jgi:hypothetical protein
MEDWFSGQSMREKMEYPSRIGTRMALFRLPFFPIYGKRVPVYRTASNIAVQTRR